MYASTISRIFMLFTATQAAVLSPSPSPTCPSNSTSTSTSTISGATSTSTPIVIAGQCNQATLQFCCPQVHPTNGESSVDFAEDCMQGNLPSSYDCFYAFEDLCCQGSPDVNGNTCEIVPPTNGDFCAVGAAGTIEAPGTLMGAMVVEEVVSCGDVEVGRIEER